MTERIPLAIKGMNINYVISQTFQDQMIERFNIKTRLYKQNKETAKQIINKFELTTTPETQLTIFEKPKKHGQPDTRIDLTNFQISNDKVSFSRSDNPDKRINMDYMSFCILTKLVTNNSKGLLEENLTLTTPKLDQTL